MVSTICNTVCIFWMHYSMVKPLFSSFRMITAKFSYMSENLGTLRYLMMIRDNYAFFSLVPKKIYVVGVY